MYKKPLSFYLSSLGKTPMYFSSAPLRKEPMSFFSAPLCKGSCRAATEGLSVPARLTFFESFRQPRHDPFLSQSLRKKTDPPKTSQPLRQNQRFRHRPLTGEAFNPKPNAHRHRRRFKSQNPAKNNPAESRAFCGVSFGKIRSQNVFPYSITFLGACLI